MYKQNEAFYPKKEVKQVKANITAQIAFLLFRVCFES